MPRAHRYEMLPHVHALLALVEQADAPELMFREIVALLVSEAPVIVEAHVVRSADHVEGVTRLGEALMGHLASGRGSRPKACAGPCSKPQKPTCMGDRAARGSEGPPSGDDLRRGSSNPR